ncbi:MAG: roadblock/LC7 domain-containing protein [bacterium]|nr:roadblock/LC7 domain-containing protein [bacterium]
MHAQNSIGQEEYKILQDQCDELLNESGIQLVFLIYSTGQNIVSAGKQRTEDLTSLAALFAGSMASASGIAKIFNEPEFSNMVFEGQVQKVLLSSIPNKGLLIVHFDNSRALGWVRFQIKKRIPLIAEQLGLLKIKFAQIKSPMSDVSEEEIDNLNFGGF